MNNADLAGFLVCLYDGDRASEGVTYMYGVLDGRACRHAAPSEVKRSLFASKGGLGGDDVGVERVGGWQALSTVKFPIEVVLVTEMGREAGRESVEDE